VHLKDGGDKTVVQPRTKQSSVWLEEEEAEEGADAQGPKSQVKSLDSILEAIRGF
jgi:hypothetical protein